MIPLLFAYGTLKRNGPPAARRLIREARFVSTAAIAGRLYDLGPYTGIYRDSRKPRVHGEVFEIPESAFARVFEALDCYEGAEFVRRRVLVTFRNGRRRVAWAYLLRKRPPKSARRISSGRFERKRGAAWRL